MRGWTISDELRAMGRHVWWLLMGRGPGCCLALALVLWATAAAAQPSLLEDVRAERAKYGASLAPAEVARLLNAVAWKNRAQGWGLLRKGSGNSCPLGDTFISCDILIHAPSVRHFDVLIDAEGRAEPAWSDAGPCVLSPSSGCEMSRFLAPVDPGGSVPDLPQVPPTTPQPVPTAIDYDRIRGLARDEVARVYDQNERLRLDADAQRAQILQRLAELEAQLKKHDEQPSWAGAFFGNRYVQLALAGVGAWLGAMQTK